MDGVNVDFAGAKIDLAPRGLLRHCRNLKCERYKHSVKRHRVGILRKVYLTFKKQHDKVELGFLMYQFSLWRYVIGASSLVLLTFLVASWLVGGALVAPNQRYIGSENLEFPVDEVMLDSESGASIATWYASSDDAKATIILLHPVRANRKAMLGRAKLFLDAGYAVILIDFQAHGESLGRYITFGHLERHDVRAAVAYARKLNPGHRIGVVAISLGAAAALLASPLGVDALVLESVYSTIAEAVDNRVAMRVGPLSYALTPLLLWQLKPRLGFSPSDLRPIDYIAKSQAPVLIANGELDRHTPITQARQLFDAANTPKRWVVFKGAAHNDLFEYNAKQYKDEVLAFLDRYLKPGNRPNATTDSLRFSSGYSVRKASSGFNRAALIAGITPAAMPIASDNKKAAAK